MDTHAFEVKGSVVGAGPVRRFGAYYAGSRGPATGIPDSLQEPGERTSAMYPENMSHIIADLLGPTPAGQELLGRELEHFAPDEAATSVNEAAVVIRPVPRTLDPFCPVDAIVGDRSPKRHMSTYRTTRVSSTTSCLAI
ncbi:hypothetical protein ITP53_06910 [Nonomuraea sp. K274]|uniref:Uncharacterized protein n=1 Tax=Nonomuraea cypriaca TaxID=1187855 RepID=A0A931A5F3_9ACTN|nr:hypothetical protein [Nonomuraea cypriaca]MBF8185473.1 hypothetical protein [Nonomuraea cypriaca]